ncbi:MAG: hypothetical protein K0R46_2862, partial [Herbinix sp.]|nr:hypothetical protein [Herbinix sp.]
VRHMSITTLPVENKIGITTRVPGSNSEFKTRLAMLGIGDEVIFFKFGSRMQLRRSNRPIILLSMGVGISTLRPVILAFLRDKSNIMRLINVNVNSSGSHIYRQELDSLADGDYINYWLDSRSSYYETLSKLSETPDALYYIVGTDDFMKETIRFLNGRNILNSDIVLDRKEEKLKEYFVEESQTIE